VEGDRVSSDVNLAEIEGDPEATVEILKQAKQHYEQLVAMAPELPAAHLGLGDTLLALQQTDAAIAAWRSGLARIDDAAQSVALHLRLVDGLIAAEELDDAEAALQALETAIQAATPRATKTQLHAWGLASSLGRARLHLARQDYAQAVPLLERVTADTSRLSARNKALWLASLAASRAALGEWDSAATTYEKAAQRYSDEKDDFQTDGRQVDNDGYREAAGAAWVMAGRPAEAIRQFESITRRTPEGLLAYARALLLLQLTRPRAERNWNHFLEVRQRLESILDRGAELPQPWRVLLLNADYQLALDVDQSRAAALAILAELEQAYADDAELQQRLVFVYEKLGQSKRAEAALARVAEAAPPHRVALLEARLLSRREEFTKARQRLVAAIEKFSPEKYPAAAESLRVGLAQLETAEGDYDEATRVLEQLGEPDLARTRQLAELALKTMPSTQPDDRPTWIRWSAALEKWEDRLRALEGSEGAYWRYYRARRLVALATSAVDARLSQAALLQDSLHSSRPYWPATYVLKGMIDERSGREDQAITAYAEAVRLGERQFRVYYRLLNLLMKAGRAAEAQQYLARMEDAIPSSPELTDMALDVLVQLDEIDRAVEMAAQAVRERPLDVLAHVLYGQMLLLRSSKSSDAQARARDHAEAELVLQNACTITENKDVRPINGLFLCYLRTDQRDKARETLQRVAQVSNLDEATRAFALGQGYELLGEQESAEEQYLAGQRLAPENTLIPLRLARLYLRNGEEAKAEVTLRRVLGVDAAMGPARRMLAAMLAARGGDKEWREARTLLGAEAGEGDQISQFDERLQAALLARRGRRADIEEALAILTRLVEQAGGTTPGDRVMLARTCMMKYALSGTDEATRQSLAATARRQYLAVVNAREVDPNHVALYVDFLLDQEDWKTAESYIAKLERLEPDAVRALGLRARLLEATGRVADLAPLVEAWLARTQAAMEEDPAEDEREALVQKYVQAGDVCSAIGAYAQAEPWYRRAFELDERTYASLAVSLARQPAREKTKAAIRLALQKAEQAQDVASAVALASVLVTGNTQAEDFAASEPIFQQQMRDRPNNPNLLQAIASVRYVEGRLDEAERLYRRVVEQRPRDAFARNNLATVLSDQENKQQDAIAHLQRAIEITGEQPFLLDTKGILLLNQNRVAEAVDVLRRAATGDDPRFLLHLVMALDRHGEEEEARRQWRRLDHHRLNRSILSSVDRKARDRLAILYGGDEAT
jgi:tetratricopeptide (TPR) repeat protein